jgi:hypothetical protein
MGKSVVARSRRGPFKHLYTYRLITGLSFAIWASDGVSETS